MPKTLDHPKLPARLGVIDVLLYLLAGSAMLSITVSFLLWLNI